MSISSTHSIGSIQSLPEVNKSSLNQELIEALTAKDNVKLEDLIKHGAPINTPFELGDLTFEALIEANFTQDEIKTSPFIVFLFVTLFEELFEESGISPLFFAVHTHNLDGVRLLIENGADVHFKALYEGRETSPLQVDAFDGGKFLEILEVLHQNGLSIEDMIDEEYQSPLELLQEAVDENMTEMVAFLERHGYHLIETNS